MFSNLRANGRVVELLELSRTLTVFAEGDVAPRQDLSLNVSFGIDD